MCWRGCGCTYSPVEVTQLNTLTGWMSSLVVFHPPIAMLVCSAKKRKDSPSFASHTKTTFSHVVRPCVCSNMTPLILYVACQVSRLTSTNQVLYRKPDATHSRWRANVYINTRNMWPKTKRGKRSAQKKDPIQTTPFIACCPPLHKGTNAKTTSNNANSAKGKRMNNKRCITNTNANYSGCGEHRVSCIPPLWSSSCKMNPHTIHTPSSLTCIFFVHCTTHNTRQSMFIWSRKAKPVCNICIRWG